MSFIQVCRGIHVTPPFRTRKENFAAGDFVVLGNEVRTEFQGAAAVVLEVTPVDCLVAVLDPSRTFKIGECHATFRAMRTIHKDWRLGTRHVIGGLQSSKMQHLNGLAATVREHRRYGHPCFVPKPESGDTRLRLCVRWECSNESNESTTGALLLEPRFLSLHVRELRGTPQREEAGGCVVKEHDEPEPAQAMPSTLLTSRRCLCPQGALEVKPRYGESALQAIDEIEPTPSHLSKAGQRFAGASRLLRCHSL